MPNFKWGLLAGIAAFIISFVLGLISGANIAIVIIRAVIFFLAFLVLGSGINILINNFFPEILMAGSDDAAQETQEGPGSRVNITLDSGEYALPEQRGNTYGTQQLGNINDLISGSYKATAAPQGIDRNGEDGYNNYQESSRFGKGWEESADDVPEAEPADDDVMHGRPAPMPSLANDSMGMGGLMDFDAMAMAFSSGSPPSAESSALDSDLMSSGGGGMEFAAAPPPSKSGAPQPLQGDFNPKELAEGIRTVLSKDR